MPLLGGAGNTVAGVILGYGASAFQQVAALNTTPNGSESGIWGGGQGLFAGSANKEWA